MTGETDNDPGEFDTIGDEPAVVVSDDDATVPPAPAPPSPPFATSSFEPLASATPNFVLPFVMAGIAVAAAGAAAISFFVRTADAGGAIAYLAVISTVAIVVVGFPRFHGQWAYAATGPRLARRSNAAGLT